MQNTPTMIKPEQILEIAIRRRWFIIIPFTLAMIAGCYFAITLPRVYSSSTSILILPQKVSGNFVSSIVSTGITARIRTISKQIMSRTNLEKLINRFQLYTEPEYEKMFLEEKVKDLRKRILVNVSSARGADTFSLSFSGKNPEKVAIVANALATYFMDENLKVREAQVLGTSEFLDDELERTKKLLEAKEVALSRFRLKHRGGMPEELERNFKEIQELQIKLKVLKQTLKTAENILVSMKNQPEQDNSSMDFFEDESFLSEEDNKLESYINEREKLLSRYTSRHPDVVRLSLAIDELKKKTEDKSGTDEPVTGFDDLSNEANENSAATFHESNIQNKKNEIGIIRSNITKVKARIDRLNRLIAETPAREQDLKVYQRDYGNISGTYQSLLSKRLEAELAINLEKKQKGEQFRLLDSASIPHKPISPDVKKILLLCLATGLGTGGGIIFLLEFLDTSFRRTEDIETDLGLTVLATIPRVKDRGHHIKRRINIVLSLLGIMVSFASFGSLAILTFNGVDQTIAFIKNYISI